MSDPLDEITSTPLQKAYREARRVAGKSAVTMVLVAHGARSGHLQDVAQAQHGKCLAALRKLIDGASAGTDAKRVGDDHDGTDPFAAIRQRAYSGGAREQQQKPPQTLDAAAIFQKWNSSARPNED